MKKLIKSIVIVLIFTKGIIAQHVKSIYFELGGNAIFYSLNFDTRFAEKQDGLGAKIGVSFYRTEAIALPVHLNYVIGKKNHGLELGAGIYFYQMLKNGADNIIFPSGVVAYKYQPVDKHFTLRIGWMPTFVKSTPGDYDFAKLGWSWPGISFGYKF